MSGDFDIRAAGTDDAGVIAALHVASRKEGYKDFADPQALAALDVAAFEKNWRQWLGETTQVLIAYRDNVAAGFIAFGPIRTRIKEDRGIMPAWPGEIYALYVHPDFWGMGAGRALMKAAAAPMRKAYWDKAVLWVIDKNKRAVTFYEKMGGQRVGAQDAQIDGRKMREIAFGWRDITRL